MVYMTLIDLERTAVLPPRLSTGDMLKSVSALEQRYVEDRREQPSKEEIETRRELKKSSKQQGSMYDVLEQFRKLSLIETVQT